jgi:hypothetical protein
VSVAEERPELLIAQSLIVEHKFTDSVREACMLPLALATHSFITAFGASGGEYGSERVGRGSEFMVGELDDGARHLK